MYKASLLLILALGVIISSCTDNSVPDGPLPITGSKFIPFAAGNYWIYHLQGFDTSGTRYTDAGLMDTLHATTMKSLRGFDAMELSENNLNFYIYYFDGDTTFQLQTTNGGKDTLQGILGVNSMNDGDELVFKNIVNPDNTILRHLLRQDASEEKLNYSFETFSCYKIREIVITGTVSTPDTNQIQVSYFAAGKGLIKQEVYFSHPVTRRLYLAATLDLSSYLVQ